MSFYMKSFLWIILFGFAFNDSAFSSDDSDVEDEVVIQIPWLPADQMELDNLYSDYRRAMGWSRFFDVSSDVCRILGRLTTFGGGVTTFVSGYYENYVLTMVAGAVAMGGSGIFELGNRADSASIKKVSEVRQMLERIRELEALRRQHGQDPHEDEDSDELDV